MPSSRGPREQKAAIVQAFDNFKRYVQEHALELDALHLKSIEERVLDLKGGKFVVVFAGKANAGKSTLINTLLGEEVVPTNFMQCTAAIIRISRAETRHVKVTFGDGRTKVKEGNNCFRWLEELAAIQAGFEAIPTSVVDEYLLAGTRPTLEVLEARVGSSLQAHRNRVEEYIDSRKKREIPVEISVGFPLPIGLEEFEVIDTPGIGALGGLTEKTLAYLNNGHALIFVHTAEMPVEDSGLHDFIRTSVTDKSASETLFLVLTNTGTQPEVAVREKLNAAVSLYQQWIDENRVVALDSLLYQVSREMMAGASVDQLEDKFEQQSADSSRPKRDQEIADRVLTMITRQRRQARMKGIIGTEEIALFFEESSNFAAFKARLADLSGRAVALQGQGILRSICKAYDNRRLQLEQEVTLLSSRSTQEFAEQQLRLNEQLSAQESMQQHVLSVLREDYLGEQGKVQSMVSELLAAFRREINDAGDEAEVIKRIIRLTEEAKHLEDQVLQLLVDGYELQLPSTSIFVPLRWSVDQESIKAEARRRSFADGDFRERIAAEASAQGAEAGKRLGSIGGPIGEMVGARMGSVIGRAAALLRIGPGDRSRFGKALYLRQLKEEVLLAIDSDDLKQSVQNTVNSFINSLEFEMTRTTELRRLELGWVQYFEWETEQQATRTETLKDNLRDVMRRLGEVDTLLVNLE